MMSQSFCERHQIRGQQPLMGVCIEEECSSRPYYCKICYNQSHQGHFVFNFTSLSFFAQGVAQNERILEPCKEELEKEYRMVDQKCKSLLEISRRKMEEKLLQNKGLFLQMIGSTIEPYNINRILKDIIHRKKLPPQTLKQYLKFFKGYFFEIIKRPTARKNRPIIYRHFQKMISQSQDQIYEIIQNLATKISSYDHNEAILQDNAIEENRQRSQWSMLFMPTHEKQMDQQQLYRVQDQKLPLDKYNLFRDASPQERSRKVILRQTKDAKIGKLIFCINVYQIRELTLINSAAICAINEQMIEQISKMKHLRVLRIFCVRGLTDNAATSMLKDMSDLQELCLWQFQSCSPFFAAALRMNNFRLKKLVFTEDLKHCIRYNEENLEFLKDELPILIPEQISIDLSKGLQNLTTVCLNKPRHTSYWIDFLQKNQQTLKEFTLQACSLLRQINQQYYQSITQDHSTIIQALQKCTQLECIKLQLICFAEQHLKNIILQNSKLISFSLSQCQHLSNKFFKALTRCRLQELSIQICDKFTAKQLSNMTTLKTLVVRACINVNQDYFAKGLENLKQLRYLSIEHCYNWVTIKSINAIAQLPKLKMLNINNNRLNARQIGPLNGCRELKTLICGQNCFSYKEFLNFSFAKRLKRVSIGKNIKIYRQIGSFQTIQMKDIADGFPNLSHLKLRGFTHIRPEYFMLMRRLSSVVLHDCDPAWIQPVRECCQRENIQFHLI